MENNMEKEQQVKTAEELQQEYTDIITEIINTPLPHEVVMKLCEKVMVYGWGMQEYGHNRAMNSIQVDKLSHNEGDDGYNG